MRANRALLALVAPAGAAVLALSACSSSGSAGTPAAAGGSSVGGGGTVITTGSGQFLTDSDGRALYLWVADTGTASTCSGACAGAWPPVVTTAPPVASGDAVSADLGTSKRSDGSLQVTYDGHPLYYFAGDSGPGTSKGQGSDGFGAKWWLVAPDGTAITGSVPATASTSSGYSY